MVPSCRAGSDSTPSGASALEDLMGEVADVATLTIASLPKLGMVVGSSEKGAALMEVREEMSTLA